MNKNDRAFIADYLYLALGYDLRFVLYDYSLLSNPGGLRDFAHDLLRKHGARIADGLPSPLFTFKALK